MTTEPNTPPQPRNEQELILAVGEWVDRQPFRLHRIPEYGIAEEVGEAFHCILKQHQRIRGFENHEFFNEKFGDALADAIIYLCDWCNMHHTFFAFGRNQRQMPAMTLQDERKIMCHILQGVAAMLALQPIEQGIRISSGEEGVYGSLAQRVATGLEYWAIIHNMDIKLLVAATWAKVSQRDWHKNRDKPADHLS